MNHPKRAHTLAKGIGLLAVAALLAALAGLSGQGAVSAAAAAPAPGHLVSPAGLLNPDGTLDLSSGFQGTLDLRGWEVTLDGERGPVLKPASRPAAQVTAWNALPNQGLSSSVSVLAVVGSDLYVGGYFTATGDGTLPNLGYIARYNTTTNTWSALPNQGLNDRVSALAVVGSDLYVGGWFTQTGDGTLTNLGRIVRGLQQQPPQVQQPGAGVAPEASTLFLLGSGLASLGAYARLRWRARKRN